MITLENIDCMEGMKRFADKHFDLAIVDPPYGISMDQGNNSRTEKRFPRKGKSWDNSIPEKNYFDELFRISKHQIIWGANYMVKHLPPSMGWICWFKTDECVGRCFSEFELAYTSFNQAARIVERKPFQRNGTRIHPTQKPSEVYAWILDKYAQPGWKILDTHIGSGSIAIACHDAGYDLTGFEIDTDYYNAALKRLRTHQSQGKLFNAA